MRNGNGKLGKRAGKKNNTSGYDRFCKDLQKAADEVGCGASVTPKQAAKWKWTHERQQALVRWGDLVIGLLLVADEDSLQAFETRRLIGYAMEPNVGGHFPMIEHLKIVERYGMASWTGGQVNVALDLVNAQMISIWDRWEDVSHINNSLPCAEGRTTEVCCEDSFA